MSEAELPPDLVALERRLLERPHVEPPAGLGPRVLAARRASLRRRPAGAWRTWAAAAAAVLVGINLSMSVAADTDWRLTPGAAPERVAAAQDWFRAQAPDLPEAEVRRQALLARAGAALAPTVHLAPTWGRIRITQEPDRWDER
jgi:hypothetical protein